MGADFMDPEPRAGVLAAGYRQGLALTPQRYGALTGSGAATATACASSATLRRRTAFDSART